jgi:N-acetylglucosaminyldiphosphoundecaprenol N-acetyl-beta-D-mannosaminyltransferase
MSYTNRTQFIGFPVDNITLKEIITFVKETIVKNTRHYIGVQNANKMYLSEKFPDLKKAIEEASIILPENAINMGMRWLGKPLKQRNIGGVRVMEDLLQLADHNSYSIYLLGAKKSNLEILVAQIKNKYPGIEIMGFRDGYFDEQAEREIVNEISLYKPNFLFVGMGSPKQELFIYHNFEKLNANISLGVGGSFNVIAGLEKNAPKWTKYGMEWLYRSFLDTSKFKRYLIINSFFLYRFIKYLLVHK